MTVYSIEKKCVKCGRFFRCLKGSDADKQGLCSVCYDKLKRKGGVMSVRELREKLSGYFGQRFHIVTARKTHQCRICEGEISVTEKCVRIFKLVIAEVKKLGWENGKLGFIPLRGRKGWIQLFYHIRCVENELFKRELERKHLKKRIREICPGCLNYKDGHCYRKMGNALFVDFYCEKVKG